MCDTPACLSVHVNHTFNTLAANSCSMLQFSSALLEQSQKGHVDQMESLKSIISNLEASMADKQAENVELKSSVKIQKQKAKKLLEQVTMHITGTLQVIATTNCVS